MMKFTSVFVIVVVSIFVNAVPVVQGETMLRMILNDNIADPAFFCTPDDSMLIGKVFDRPLNRRHLRSSPVDQAVRPIDFIHEMDQSFDSDEDRELQIVYSASYCKKECDGYVAGSCHKTGCTWYGKNRQLKDYGKGFLSNSTLCQVTSDSINADLDFLVANTMVSSTCIALLNKPRKFECFEDVMYGIIDGFKVIDADDDVVMIPYLHARRDICGLKALNIEVMVNPCVASVNITLVNKKAGFTATVVHDTTVPGNYTLFGMNGAGNYKGEHLPFGNYTLDATPDGNENKTRSRKFFLAEC